MEQHNQITAHSLMQQSTTTVSQPHISLPRAQVNRRILVQALENIFQGGQWIKSDMLMTYHTERILGVIIRAHEETLRTDNSVFVSCLLSVMVFSRL